MPGEDEVFDGEVVDDESSDAINTESANDGEEVAPAPAGATAPGSQEHPDTVLAAQRLDDLQRLNAEYVNYKRRVDRDRAVVQERAVRDVLETVLPVLDDIQAARDHGDLTDGPFASIADKLEASFGKFGLTRFGAVGEPFDPMHHEALMHAAWDSSNPELPADATATTVVQVLQAGYRTGDQVLRPARVAVADPE
ncbi:nucleotide exchange factor GrpE [Knoellia locipacati]|uniref:Protein GrpE n=2 Tax=Knoellia locipacati TaxID=882824 RepID=A0A512SYA3_9MICO|nr:protein GrpE [Knoellia locipacati]